MSTGDPRVLATTGIPGVMVPGGSPDSTLTSAVNAPQRANQPYNFGWYDA
jgi:hypothetical protein